MKGPLMHMSLAFPWDTTLGHLRGIVKLGGAQLAILSKGEGNWTRQNSLVKGFLMKKTPDIELL